MKKLFLLLSILLLASRYGVKPEADEEAVLIDKPLIWGHGGIDKTPVTTGFKWVWFSTSYEKFKIIPQRYDEEFNDIFSNDNTPLDFNTYINIQIESGKTPTLLQNYGKDWYKNNIQVYYRNKTREYVSSYSLFDLISNREVLRDIDEALIKDMRNYVAELSRNKELPIKILSITTGAARPNQDQLEEMNKTAQYIQQKRTMEQKAIAENARAEAEKKRAEADKAYMHEMNLTQSQFISLKMIETLANKNGANIDVLIGGSEMPMWNIKRQ